MTEPTIGHNIAMRPLPRAIAEAEDLPAEVVKYLDEDFARIPKQLEELLARAREVPREISDDSTMGGAAKLVKELRDLTREIESHRVAQKAPYLRGEQAVDNWFFAHLEKAVRRNKAARPGAADVLAARVDDFNQRKLRAEQERRRQEEERARREAEEKRRIEVEARRKAEEDKRAAERARSPERIEEKRAEAQRSDGVVAAATTEADLANERAQQARMDALAKPADLVRTRVEEGPTVTMATESYAVVEDYGALDLAALRPFIARAALDKAVRDWARVTNYNQKMAGVAVGRRQKTVVR